MDQIIKVCFFISHDLLQPWNWGIQTNIRVKMCCISTWTSNLIIAFYSLQCMYVAGFCHQSDCVQSSGKLSTYSNILPIINISDHLCVLYYIKLIINVYLRSSPSLVPVVTHGHSSIFSVLVSTCRLMSIKRRTLYFMCDVWSHPFFNSGTYKVFQKNSKTGHMRLLEVILLMNRCLVMGFKIHLCFSMCNDPVIWKNSLLTMWSGKLTALHKTMIYVKQLNF